jgi:hypothetical protein
LGGGTLKTLTMTQEAITTATPENIQFRYSHFRKKHRSIYLDYDWPYWHKLPHIGDEVVFSLHHHVNDGRWEFTYRNEGNGCGVIAIYHVLDGTCVDIFEAYEFIKNADKLAFQVLEDFVKTVKAS